MDSLFAHSGSGRPVKGHGQLIERRFSRTDRLQEGDEKIFGIEFPRILNEEACLSCNFVKLGIAEKRARGEHITARTYFFLRNPLTFRELHLN